MMSTITEREKSLIKAMKSQNFEAFFDGDQEDAYDTITTAMSTFVDYQNHVINMSILQPTLYARYEGQELRDKITNLDTTRRMKHDSAIANMSMLNRICDAYGVEPIAPVDTKDRYAVADFIGNFCAEIYEENKSGKNLSPEQQGKLVQQHVTEHKTYQPDKIAKRLADLDAKFGDIINNHNEIEEGYQP